MRRAVALIVMAATVVLLSACSLIIPLLPGAPSGPITATGIEGRWNFTRVLADSTVSDEGYRPGLTNFRYIVIRDVLCADDGSCTATWTSSETDFDAADAASADLAFVDGELTAVFERQVFDCTTADGTVIQPMVVQIDNTYTLDATGQSGDEVTAFAGQGTSAFSTDPGAGDNCQSNGERTWNLTMQRAD